MRAEDLVKSSQIDRYARKLEGVGHKGPIMIPRFMCSCLGKGVVLLDACDVENIFINQLFAVFPKYYILNLEVVSTPIYLVLITSTFRWNTLYEFN